MSTSNTIQTRNGLDSHWFSSAAKGVGDFSEASQQCGMAVLMGADEERLSMAVPELLEKEA
jgi:hypothetical protein